jgi:hypothetical protein
MDMKVSSKDFRVAEGDRLDLGKRPTITEPVCRSKAEYKNLLEAHVAQLSDQQQLL